jgi:TetR/AcrR family transcriptional regulator, tetracycline repressor protein
MTGEQETSRPAAQHPLWLTPPDNPGVPRRTLSRGQVVSEALAIVSAVGAPSLTMRGLADRLGVVPGALYRHVRSKEQLQDLVLDAVLAEIDMRVDQSLDWAGQVTALAGRLRTVLEDHPGVAALLKSRDLISPHSLALAEAFLAPLHAAGLPARQAVLAYRLVYDYTVGFALGDRAAPGAQRLQNAQASRQLLAFLRSLPADRFPVLAAIGEQIWTSDRDERFTASMDTIITGLRRAGDPHPPAARKPPAAS